MRKSLLSCTRNINDSALSQNDSNILLVWYTISFKGHTNRCFLFRLLTLPALHFSESCIKIKINLIFIFTILHGASKGFMKAFKAEAEAPQRNVKIKFKIFFSSSGIGAGRIKTICAKYQNVQQL